MSSHYDTEIHAVLLSLCANGPTGWPATSVQQVEQCHPLVVDKAIGECGLQWSWWGHVLYCLERGVSLWQCCVCISEVGNLQYLQRVNVFMYPLYLTQVVGPNELIPEWWAMVIKTSWFGEWLEKQFVGWNTLYQLVMKQLILFFMCYSGVHLYCHILCMYFW